MAINLNALKLGMNDRRYPGASLVLDFENQYYRVGNTRYSSYEAIPSAFWVTPSASAATAETADSKLAYFGSVTNLLLQSQTLTNASWIVSASTVLASPLAAPDNTATSSALYFTASGTSQIYQSITLTAATYTLSAWVRTATGTKSFRLKYYNGTTDSFSADFTATTTWQRFTHTFTGTAVSGNVSICNVTAADTGTIIAWGTQLELGSSAGRYVPTTTVAVTSNNARITSKGLLTEESRTNHNTYSDLITVAYGVLAGSMSNGTNGDLVQGTRPDGTDGQVRRWGVISGLAVRFGASVGGTATTTYTGSIWMRTRDGSTMNSVNLDVNDATTAAISITPQWQRFTVSGSHPTNPYRFFDIAFGSNGEIEVWGAQIETGAFVTSYIPTQAAAVTRPADNININSFNLSNNYTVFADFTVASAATNSFIVGLANDGNNYTSIRKTSTATLAITRRTTAYNNDFTLQSNILDNTPYKAAVRIASGNIRGYVNGTPGIEDKDSTLVIPSTSVCLSSLTNGASIDNSKFTRCVVIYPFAMTDTQLRKMTEPVAYLDINFVEGEYKFNNVPVSGVASIPGWTYSGGTANGTGCYGANADGSLRFFPSATNMLLQSADPTQWETGITSNGVTANIIATGTESGKPYADMRFTGTSTGVASALRLGSNLPTATPNTTYTAQFSAKVIAGTVPAGPTGGTIQVALVEYLNSSYVSETNGPIALSANLTFGSCTRTLNGTSNKVGLYATLRFNSGAVIDVTVRVYAPQIELGSNATTYIPTTSAAVTIGTPRITDAGYWSESASANQLTYSQQFDNAIWAATRATVTANQILAPDKTLTADKIVPTAVGSTHYLAQTLTLNTANDMTLSVYMKAGELTLGIVELGLGCSLAVDLLTGVATPTTYGSGVFTSYSVSSAGNGWWRCNVTGKETGGSTKSVMSIVGTPALTGDGTSGIYVWQADLALSTLLSSPIPTTTASVTRSTDLAYVDALTTVTNILPNSTATNGSTVGIGGALPTGWNFTSTSGTTQAIIGTGTQDGLTYIDIRWYGVPNSSSDMLLDFCSSTASTVAASTAYTTSLYHQLVGGSLSNVGPQYLSIRGGQANGTATTTTTSNITAPTSTLTRVSHTGTTNASTLRGVPRYSIAVTSGLYVDFTIRFMAPQLEIGSVASVHVPTTTTAVTQVTSGFTPPTSGTVCATWMGRTIASSDVNAIFALAPKVGSLDRIDMREITNSAIQSVGTNGGVDQWSYAGLSRPLSSVGVGAISFTTNNIQLFMNGTSAGSDTVATIPRTERLWIGSIDWGTINAKTSPIRRIQLFPYAMNTSQLSALTNYKIISRLNDQAGFNMLKEDTEAILLESLT